MEHEVLNDQRSEAFAEDFFRGRVVSLNGMLRGIGVRAFEKHGNYKLLEENDTGESKPQVYIETLLMQRLPAITFVDFWDDVLIKHLSRCSDREFCVPGENNFPQRVGLGLVREWMALEEVEKSNLETASCNSFLATGNSFPWEKDPELLTEITKTVILIGKAHRILQSRS